MIARPDYHNRFYSTPAAVCIPSFNNFTGRVDRQEQLPAPKSRHCATLTTRPRPSETEHEAPAP